jgi:hypothetical protein
VRDKEACAQQIFHFFGRGFGSLVSNSRARDFAGKLVQIQRNSEPFLAGHSSITLDLCVERGSRIPMPA